MVYIYIYLAGSLVTFALLLRYFVRDSSTPMSDLKSWQVLLVAALLWPVALASLSYAKRKAIKSLGRRRIATPVHPAPPSRPSRPSHL